MRILSDIELFCKKIQNLMIEKGLSKKEMCKIMHIGKESVQLILCNKIPKRFGVRNIFYLCEFFDKSPDWFFKEL